LEPPKPPFDLKVFLTKASGGKTSAEYRTNNLIFVQGDTAKAIFYIKEGKVKLTVVSPQGKEAVVAISERLRFLWRRVSGGAEGAFDNRHCNFGVLSY
jgi:CRP/FNR family cyclic AMP-dependent transcriptional regulator